MAEEVIERGLQKNGDDPEPVKINGRLSDRLFNFCRQSGGHFFVSVNKKQPLARGLACAKVFLGTIPSPGANEDGSALLARKVRGSIGALRVDNQYFISKR
jgi:hypothetical protein